MSTYKSIKIVNIYLMYKLVMVHYPDRTQFSVHVQDFLDVDLKDIKSVSGQMNEIEDI